MFLRASERSEQSEHTVVLSSRFLYIIGERAKRARRYLVMSMESRDIYIYIYVRLFLIPMRALVICE